MDNLASLVLDRLIEKTFAEMAQSEKLAFIEKLFVAMETGRSNAVFVEPVAPG